jgi:hypothetical protein
MRKVLAVCVLAVLGCGGSSTPTPRDSGPDKPASEVGAAGTGGQPDAVSPDMGGSPDLASDMAAPPDTSTETSPDLAVEAGGDTVVDKPADMATEMGGAGDVAADKGGGDAAPDAGTDVAADVGGGGDVAAEVAPEVGAEVGSDVAIEAGLEAPPACGANNTACDFGVKDGLCKSNACAACVDVTDDAACTAAYGTASNPYICLQGGCVPGNCRVNADCASPAGSICGLSKANTCAKCASDAQCATNYGAGFICTTNGASAGACVAGTCAGGDDTMCTANTADVCCGGACSAGECCPGAAGDTLCKNKLGNSAVCTSGHSCSTCQTVAGKDYLVDPVNGSDTGSTGSSTPSASCAFKTITRALQFIGPGAVSGTTITIVGGATAGAAVVVKTGETFPVVVPANVTIIGKDFVTVEPPAATSGFLLGAPNSGLKHLTLDGSGHTAQSGVGVQAGSTDTTSLVDVDVRNFLGDGIVVAGGVLTIGSGVTSNSNGTTQQRANGLHVANRMGVGGSVFISLPTDQVAFNDNAASGITVDGLSSVSLSGVPGALGAGTIVANGNQQNGIVINQSGATPNLNLIAGVVAWANLGGYGISIVGGSNVRVRNSVFLSNNNAGALLQPVGTNADVSKIDLGTMASPGKNTFQASLGNGPNLGGGICMTFAANAGAQLDAMGNNFAGRDCSTATPGQITGGRNIACANRVDVSFFGPTNDILVANCTHP